MKAEQASGRSIPTPSTSEGVPLPHQTLVPRRLRDATRLGSLTLLILALALVTIACSQQAQRPSGAVPPPQSAVDVAADVKGQAPDASLDTATDNADQREPEIRDESLKAGAELSVESPAEVAPALDEL